MSGFIALVHTDGSPVDPSLLGRLTNALAFRGPDRQHSRADGSVGMGHALLATTPEAARECQPSSLDGEVWIVADARIDGRAALVAELAPVAGANIERATDTALVLHAYQRWGEACVEHLIGDFAFVIWDGRRRTLFCARDHFGVKLLYYMHVGHALVVGNTLQSLRRHPAITDRLDETVMGSMVLWGENWDRTTTAFADVKAVPAAHSLTWSVDRAEVATRSWWERPEEGPPLRYSDRRDYLDHFESLLAQAVGDRLRAPSVSIFMSGGVDSPMLAAVALDALGGSGGARQVSALTVVFDRLIPDRERHWSSVVARHLGIPIHHFQADMLYESWDWLFDTTTPEPEIYSSIVPSRGAREQAASTGRVVLTGFDGDRLLSLDVGALWKDRLRRLQLGDLAREAGWHARRGRLPRIGVRSALGRWRSRLTGGGAYAGYPPWLSPAFEKKQSLRDRWIEWPTSPSSPRGGAYQSLATPAWRTVLDPMDTGMTGLPLEHRHPLIDLRLVKFALSLPPVPWCVDKELFRVAMKARLPESVLRRPKEPLQGDPIMEGVLSAPGPFVHGITPELAEYVDVARYVEASASLRLDPSAARRLSSMAFNTFALNGWLQSPMRRLTAAPGAS